MIINKSQKDEILTLALDGKLDTNTSLQLEEALNTAINEAKKIVLDFSNLQYVSSAGFRVLLMGQKKSNSQGVLMVLKGVSANVMEVFEMVGFSAILNFE